MPDAPDKTDLSFVTTDELVEEIYKRNDIVLICYLARRTDELFAGMTRWKDMPGAIGLARMAEHELLTDWYRKRLGGESDAS